MISDEEPDTSGEAEAQSTVHNVAVTEGCTAAIAEPLRQCHTSELPPETCTDIGGLLAPTKSIDEKCHTLNSLSNSEKYSYIFKHNPPPRVLPSTFSHGCNRKFKIAWMNKYPWLRYSTKLDGVFCGPRAILLSSNSRHDKGILVNKPFNNWVKISNTLTKHSHLVYHSDCMQAADALKDSIVNPTSCRIDIISDTRLQTRIIQNKHILQQIVRAVLFLGKQGLAFRGDKEDINSSKNPGNFLALLKDYAEHDEILKAHLQHPQARNATYISPRSQNDIIDVIGIDIIQANIIEEVKKAEFYSVLADEVSSHNTEHLPIFVRFVDGNFEIREDFIGYAKLERVRAKDIANAIKGMLLGAGLSLNELRGQGYDGASTMAGERSGVQKKIREIQSKALYTHCAGHSLNLAIINSCSVSPIQNCISQVKGITIWIKSSPKREELLKAVYHKGIQCGAVQSRFPLLNVCITRWVENIDGWERFALSHPFLLHMCEVIIYGDDNFELFNDNWAADDKRNAMAYLKILKLFEFIFCLVPLQRSLYYLKEVAVKLQGKNQDIVSGVAHVEEASRNLNSLREKADEYTHRIFEHSSRIAAKSNIAITMPRVSQRQSHRANTQFTSIEDYFKKVVIIPFLDHLISNLSYRFDAHMKQAAGIQRLIPTNITEELATCNIREAVNFYKDDLQNPDVIDEELHRWKLKWLAMSFADRPQTLSSTLKEPGSFPNIFTLLKLFVMLPLTSCSCERSASALRRLNNYMRCSQTEQRLSHCLQKPSFRHIFNVKISQVCQRLGSMPPDLRV